MRLPAICIMIQAYYIHCLHHNLDCHMNSVLYRAGILLLCILRAKHVIINCGLYPLKNKYSPCTCTTIHHHHLQYQYHRKTLPPLHRYHIQHTSTFLYK